MRCTHLLIIWSLLLMAIHHPLQAAEQSGAGVKAESAEGTLVVRLSGTLPLRAQPELLSPFTTVTTLHQANELLRKAFRAPQSHLVLDLSHGFMPSMAAAEALADTLGRRPSGQRVVCLLDNVSDAALVVAAATDEVVMAEAGLLLVSGLAFTIDHYQGLLEKLGIAFTAVVSGPQKIAPEPLTRSEPSAEALAEYRSLLAELDETLIALSTREGFDQEALRAARAQAPQTASIAVASGMVDRAVEPGAFFREQPQPLRRLHGHGEQPDLQNFAGLMNFWSQLLSGPREPRHPRMVAVVELEGMIIDGDEPLTPGQITSQGVHDLAQELAENNRIVAVVVRVSSGGGSAGASDRIYHSLRWLSERKPVVTLFDDVAASGGYYIGLAGREIIAHQATITGSIGVFAVIPDLSGTRDKLGVHRTTLMSNPRADLLTTNAMNDERLAGLRGLVAATDQRFRDIVSQRRELDAAAVEAVADGRVFTGARALELGLVDALGSLPEAVVKAREAAGIDTPLPLAIYPREPGLAELLGLGPMSLAPTGLRGFLRSMVAGVDGHPRILAWHGLAPLH